jgi:hypothetical protein
MAERARLREARGAILRMSIDSPDRKLCDPFVELLPINGASVSMLGGVVSQATLCASDAVAARLDELQLDLGEGPCWQALGTRRPVLVPDVRGVEHPAWPVFGAAVQDCPAEAIFAFPLRVGALGLGALDLYRTDRGPLGEQDVHDAAALADTLAWVVLTRLLNDTGQGELDDRDREYSSSRREVHQATGMVLAQVGTTAAGAFALLRAHAFSQNRSVQEIARDVIERRLRFDALD